MEIVQEIPADPAGLPLLPAGPLEQLPQAGLLHPTRAQKVRLQPLAENSWTSLQQYL
jgi:hypothetical protein